MVFEYLRVTLFLYLAIIYMYMAIFLHAFIGFRVLFLQISLHRIFSMPSQIDRKMKEYEEFEQIVEAISRNIPGAITASGRKNKISGRSGIRHQIDVSAEYIFDGKRKLRLIECKLRTKDPVNLEEVMAFWARINDIQSCLFDVDVCGNFVTSSYYTEGAKKYAECYGIPLNHSKANGETWGLTFEHVIVHLGVAGSAPPPEPKKP